MSAKPLILFVDDREVDRELLAEAVRVAGDPIELVGADSVEDGYRRCLMRRPDVLLVDLSMPRRNGLELVRQVRETAQLEQLPIVVFSSSRNPRDHDAARAAGATRFCSKPDRFEGFVGFVKELAGAAGPEPAST